MTHPFRFARKLLPILIFVLLFADQSRAQFWETGDNFAPKAINEIIQLNGSVFVATSQGLYHTSDGLLGEAWQLIQSIPNGNVSSMTYRGNTIFATSDSIVYRSTDAGATWRPISPAAAAKISSIALSPNGSIFIATLGFGIFRTTDNGAHWSPASNGIGTLSDISKIVAAHDGTLYATQIGQSGIWYSSDNGANWQIGIGKFHEDQLFLAEHPDGRIFSMGYTTINVSSDKGKSWTAIDSSNNDFHFMGIDSSSRMYCSIVGPFILRSSDLQHWDTLPIPDIVVTNMAFGMNGSYFGIVGNAYYSGTPHVIRTTNDGSTWAFTAHVLPSSLANINNGGMESSDLVLTHNQILLLSTTEISDKLLPVGVYRSTNEGSAWYRQTVIGVRDTIEALVVADDNTIYAATFDTNGFAQSTDDGATWQIIHPTVHQDPAHPYSASMYLAQTMVYLGGSNLFWTNGIDESFVSHDGAKSWDWAPGILPSVSGYLHFVWDWRGYAYVNYKRTSDGGNTWKELHLPNGDNAWTVAVEKDGSILDLAPTGLWHSTDHGDSWTKIGTTPNAVDPSKLLVDSSGILYAFYNGGCTKSTDRGATWTAFSSGISKYYSVPVNAAVNKSGRVFMAPMVSGFYRTIVSSSNSVNILAATEGLHATIIKSGNTTLVHIDLPSGYEGSGIMIEAFDELGRSLSHLKQTIQSLSIEFPLDKLGLRAGLNILRISCNGQNQILKLEMH